MSLETAFNQISPLQPLSVILLGGISGLDILEEINALEELMER